MSTTTTRNSLVKPGYADAADIAVINSDLDTIDAAIAKCNYAATAAPTANDDSGDGYSIGSVWFDTTNNNIYIAKAVTVGAAIWNKTGVKNTVSAASNPSVTDDIAAGYAIGSIWINQTTNHMFIAVDVSAGAAVWRSFGISYGTTNTAPTANDDLADGFGIGSTWYDYSANKYYVCQSATAGAAVWVQIPTTGTAWDIGAVEIRALTFQSDEASAAPFTVASSTKVTNLNADKLDGLDDTAFVKQTLADAKGDMIAASGSDTWAKVTVGSDGHSLVGDASATAGVSWQPMYSGESRNLIINPEFMINQTGINQYMSTTNPANNDDTYLIDQWTLLSDGNDIMDVWRSSAVYPSAQYGTGCGASVLLQTETANKKAGIIQFIPNQTARRVVGGVVSLRFWAYTMASYPNANIMAGVLSWSSTADAVTSDVVSAWNAAGAAPTLATNWTFENTPAQLALVNDTWTEYKIENIAIDTASTTNIAVFIWLDDTDSTVDDRLYISGVQLNEGPTCLPYSCPPLSDQMTQCTKYFYCINSAAGSYPHLGNAGANTTSTVYIEYHHPTEWYATLPTMTMIGSNWVIAGTAVNSYASEGDKKQITYRLTASGTPFTQYLSYLVYANNEATARVYMSSRL